MAWHFMMVVDTTIYQMEMGPWIISKLRRVDATVDVPKQ
jgi:hypothetical protein